MTIDSIRLQLGRLQRHYDVAVRTSDAIALLDLTHTLRIWTELKGPLRQISPKFSSSIGFKSGSPAKKAMKVIRRHEHVVCYMPGGVITYASNGDLASGPEFFRPGPAMSTGVSLTPYDDHVVLGKYWIVAAALEDSTMHAMAHEVEKRCNYEQWLASEAAHVALRTSAEAPLQTFTLSRENVIKRLANTLDGSHPSASVTELTNQFDLPVQHLMRFTAGGLPIPYYIMLKIAQDLLSLAPGLLGFDSERPAR